MTPLCWHVLKQDNVKASLEHQLSCNSCQIHASVTHSTSHEKKADEATHVMYAQETPGMTCTEGKIFAMGMRLHFRQRLPFCYSQGR